MLFLVLLQPYVRSTVCYSSTHHYVATTPLHMCFRTCYQSIDGSCASFALATNRPLWSDWATCISGTPPSCISASPSWLCTLEPERCDIEATYNMTHLHTVSSDAESSLSCLRAALLGPQDIVTVNGASTISKPGGGTQG